jgi:hypothetical protein
VHCCKEEDVTLKARAYEVDGFCSSSNGRSSNVLGAMVGQLTLLRVRQLYGDSPVSFSEPLRNHEFAIAIQPDQLASPLFHRSLAAPIEEN